MERLSEELATSQTKLRDAVQANVDLNRLVCRSGQLVNVPPPSFQSLGVLDVVFFSLGPSASLTAHLPPHSLSSCAFSRVSSFCGVVQLVDLRAVREREAQERSLDSPAGASPASGFSRADRVAAIDAGSLQAALDGQKAAFEVQRAQLEAEISSLNGQLGRVREALSVREDTVTDLQLRLSDSRDAHFKEKTHLQVLCVVCCVLCVVCCVLELCCSSEVQALLAYVPWPAVSRAPVGALLSSL